MSTYRKEWPCCDSVTETQSWEPEQCPFCTSAPCPASPVAADTMGDAKDAARYRWLRAQHWNKAPLCVVMRPKQAVKLGHDCPALDRLDAAIDEAMGTPVVEVPDLSQAGPGVQSVARNLAMSIGLGHGLNGERAKELATDVLRTAGVSVPDGETPGLQPPSCVGEGGKGEKRG